eukprot:321807-Amphidinium_carterae.2
MDVNAASFVFEGGVPPSHLLRTNNCLCYCFWKALVQCLDADDGLRVPMAGGMLNHRQLRKKVLASAILMARSAEDHIVAKALERAGHAQEYADELSIAAVVAVTGNALCILTGPCEDGGKAYIFYPRTSRCYEWAYMRLNQAHFEAITIAPVSRVVHNMQRRQVVRPSGRLCGGAANAGAHLSSSTAETQLTVHYRGRLHHLAGKPIPQVSAHEIAALYIGTLPGATTIYWVDDKHVILQDIQPGPVITGFQKANLLEAVNRFTLVAPSRTLDGVLRSFVAGLRATREFGLTAASTHATNTVPIVALNALLKQTINVSWHSLQIMWHFDIPKHRDVMDSEHAYMLTLDGPSTHLVHTLATDSEVRHSTNSTWIQFNPLNYHEVEVSSVGMPALSVVLYTPKRESPAKYIPTLKALCFPAEQVHQEKLEPQCNLATPPPGRLPTPLDADFPPTSPMDPVIYPGIDPMTSQPVDIHRPSWIHGLSPLKAAQRFADLFVYIVPWFVSALGDWKKVSVRVERIAMDLCNARHFYQTTHDAVEATRVWKGVLDREIGHENPLHKQHLEHWFAVNELHGWTQIGILSQTKQPIWDAICGEYQAHFTDGMPLDALVHNKRQCTAASSSHSGIIPPLFQHSRAQLSPTQKFHPNELTGGSRKPRGMRNTRQRVENLHHSHTQWSVVRIQQVLCPPIPPVLALVEHWSCLPRAIVAICAFHQLKTPAIPEVVRMLGGTFGAFQNCLAAASVLTDLTGHVWNVRQWLPIHLACSGGQISLTGDIPVFPVPASSVSADDTLHLNTPNPFPEPADGSQHSRFANYTIHTIEGILFSHFSATKQPCIVAEGTTAYLCTALDSTNSTVHLHNVHLPNPTQPLLVPIKSLGQGKVSIIAVGEAQLMLVDHMVGAWDDKSLLEHYNEALRQLDGIWFDYDRSQIRQS